jgi:hypothetical protein
MNRREALAKLQRVLGRTQHEMATIAGDTSSGYTASLTIGIAGWRGYRSKPVIDLAQQLPVRSSKARVMWGDRAGLNRKTLAIRRSQAAWLLWRALY